MNDDQQEFIFGNLCCNIALKDKVTHFVCYVVTYQVDMVSSPCFDILLQKMWKVA